MAKQVIDLEVLHKELNLSERQIEVLSDAFEKLMADYSSRYVHFSRRGDGENDFFEGVVSGINNCYKIVNKINDDYNIKD